MIIRCEFEPGQLLTEAQIVRVLKVGKTPVREAFTRLAQDGLVNVLPRRGYRVDPITLRYAEELFSFRLIVEPAAAALAAGHVDRVKLHRLDELCRVGYTPGDPKSVARFLGANTEFHITVAQASGNARLAESLTQILHESERLFRIGLKVRNRSDQLAHEHRELVEALVAGDSERARQIAADQIVEARHMVSEALMASAALRDTPI